MAGPLTDIRVLDLSRVMAGPWCSQILADLGAEVIKIERPGNGDETRAWGPPWLPDKNNNATGEAAYYLSANRGKYSLAVDLKQAEGQQIIADLAGNADIFLENFKPGSLERKGLDYTAIRKLNPGIIYCSITGFGQTGPRSGDAGYDYLIQGLGGLMSITGIKDGQPGAGPLRTGIPIADLATGLYAAIAILSALHHREQTGQGQYIDMALLDSLVALLGNQAQNYFLGDDVPGRSGALHPNLAPYQPFAAADGNVIIAIGNDAQFQRLCQALERHDLAVDKRFCTNAQRVLHRNVLAQEIGGVTATHNSEALIQLLAKSAIPCGPVNTLEEVFAEPQVVHRQMQIELDHPVSGKVSAVANPIRFSETTIEYNKSPPLLGADTDDILQRYLGKNQDEIDVLRRKGVIQ